MIGIIGAMESEVDGLKAAVEGLKVTSHAGIEFYQGTLFGTEVVIARSGIGKVNAALCTQNMIYLFSPRLIINTGCAAGVGKGIQIGDIVLADTAVQHDLEYGPLGTERGYLDRVGAVHIPADKKATQTISEIAESLGIHTRVGVVATGDQFLCDPVKKAEIRDYFDAQAVEMEGGAIAHAAYQNGVPFVILRSISDNGDDTAAVEFESFVKQVNQKNMQILKIFLEREQ
ncbi:MAG: 5'-methylthioadenosine/adenosylhomocysteine nucleosidase [Clostridia bacterium]|nr:5'-methylthioadenosine/adenosylhomocysteine nucleosidase [Clostridia bacterium]